MKLIGIDPGYTGAAVVLAVTPRGHEIVDLLDCPFFQGKSSKDVDGVTIAMFFERVVAADPRVFVVIEKVGPRPHDGAKRAFDFGCGYGVYLGVLAGLSLPHLRVAPAVWKRAMKLSSDKDLSRQRATQLWPGARDPVKPERGLFARKLDEGRAEAALLAEYGRELKHITHSD